nr:DUF6538 domain-containing protein [uncultured Desulfobulbus sp.]
MRLPSYLQRNQYGKYYFRIVFPQEIRLRIHKQEFKRSLRTSICSHAVSISRILKVKIDQVFRIILLYNMDWTATKKLLDKVSMEILEGYKDYLFVHGLYPDVARNYPDRKAEEDAQYFLEMKRFPDTYFEQEGSINDIHQGYGEDADIVQHILWRREGGGKLANIESVKNFADRIIADKALVVADTDYELFCQKVAEMLWQLKDDREALFQQLDSGQQQDVITNTPAVDLGQEEVEAVNTCQAKACTSITFDQLIEKYIEYKVSRQSWSAMTLRGKKLALGALLEIFQYIKNSETVYLHDLNAEDVGLFERTLRQMPSNRKKIYKDCSIADLMRNVNRREISESEFITDKTYNDYCILLTGMMNFAVEPRQGFIPCNYFTDLKVKVRDAVKKIPFTSRELELFFNTDLFVLKKVSLQFAWRYWIPVLMLYHGTRLEEVSQPFLSDIEQVEGIWCLKIEQEKKKPRYRAKDQKEKIVKNPSSVRYVPLHDKLLQLGFMEYVTFLQGKGEKKLFPDLSKQTPNGQYIKHGAKVTAFFTEDSEKQSKTSYLTKCGVKTPDTPPRTKALICFRHTVQKVLNDHPSNVISGKIDQLVGHSPQSIGIKHYSGYSEATIKAVVDLIDFPDANLPWDKDPDYGKIKFSWE